MPRISAATPIAFTDPLPDSVDVAIIGAGVVGTATAWFLARRGKRVLLCEKGRVAGEQSSRNWGWIRQQGRDRAELPIMIESNRIWRSLASETGEADLTFTQSGCVYVAKDEAQLAKQAQWHELAREHQLDTRMLTADEVKELCGGIQGDFAGGMVTPSDGRGEPWVAVPALARAAQREGVTVIEECAVRILDVEAGAVTGVVTEKGRVKAQAVLLAAGAWSSVFAANAGVDLPQLSVRSTAGRTHVSDKGELPNAMAVGVGFRRRADGGYTVSTGDLAEHYLSGASFRYFSKFLPLIKAAARDLKIRPFPPAGYPGAWGSKSRWGADDETPFEQMRVLDPPASDIVRRRLEARMPGRAPWLADAGIAEMWAGMIDVTPDAVPYLCESPSPEGLFIGTGMSGHGFGIGPGVGRVLADLIEGKPPGHDLTRFRFDRFSDGSPIMPGPY